MKDALKIHCLITLTLVNSPVGQKTSLELIWALRAVAVVFTVASWHLGSYSKFNVILGVLKSRRSGASPQLSPLCKHGKYGQNEGNVSIIKRRRYEAAPNVRGIRRRNKSSHVLKDLGYESPGLVHKTQRKKQTSVIKIYRAISSNGL